MKLIIPALVLTVYTASEAMSGSPVPATGASSATASVATTSAQDFGPTAEPAESACGAGHMHYLLGQQVEEVDLQTLSQHVRVAYPNTPEDGGENPSRLNLDVTHAGVILDASCG